MSVTWDLYGDDGPLKLFLDEWLPGRHEAVRPWRRALRRGRLSRPAKMPFREDIGTAFELRVGLDLAQQPAGYQRELAYLPPSRCEQLMWAAGFDVAQPPFEVEPTVDPLLRGWKRVSRPDLPTTDEQVSALLACYDMAHVSGVFGLKDRGWSVEEARTWIHHPGLFASYLDQHHEKARGSLNVLWERYLASGRVQLLACGDRVVLKPEVATNYGVGDLVVGRTLVDVKVYDEPDPHLEKWLDQLLGYALLDEFGYLYIERLAIYLGWDSLMLETDLDGLIASARERPNVQRDELRRAIREFLDDRLRLARERRNRELLGHWIPGT